MSERMMTTGEVAVAMPTDRLVYTAEAAKIFGLYPKTLLRMVKEGRFPAPLKTRIGNGECWKLSTLTAHLQSLE